MVRTAVNVTGDAAISCIIARSENELDPATYNSRSTQLQT
jgi:Na+/H+-dicarboxylate symporter